MRPFPLRPTTPFIWMVAVGCLLLLLSGCATYSVERDADGGIVSVSSRGFLRTISVCETRKYAADGKTVVEESLSVSTASQSGEVLGATNQLVGTMAGVARDVMP